MNNTYICLGLSFLIAVMITLPSVDFLYAMNWTVINQSPLGWLSAGMRYIDTFFHEIGHTIFAWFYGYPSLPSFDLQHGGGMAYWGAREIMFNYGVYFLIAAGLVYWKNDRTIQIMLVALGLFHVATAYNDAHEIIKLYMGHGSTFLLSAFFLYRAWFDVAPRGLLERYMNGIIGFGMLFKNMILFWGLIYDDVVKAFYHNQKGSHGFGDFSRIEAMTPFSMAQIAGFSLVLCALAMILPAALYLKEGAYVGNDLDPIPE